MDDDTGAQVPNPVWLTLALTGKFNARMRRELRAAIPSPQYLGRVLAAALAGDIEAAQHSGIVFPRGLLQAMRSSDVQRATDATLAWQAASTDHHLLGLDHPHYPPALLATTDAPPLLYVRGHPELLAGPQVAIVGSRKASRSAQEQAALLAAELAQAGIGIVSGLALGIDGAAHRGCLAQQGLTIAVAATAPDKVYPRAHSALADEIISSGALITEFPLGSPLRPGCFPRRNRLISGLSLGVVVVEAALRSGSLITARHALEQGREVMAMPGSVLNPQTRGCHALIKQGGALVETASDVLALLAQPLRHHLFDAECQQTLPGVCHAEKPDNPNKTAPADPIAATLLDCLGYDPLPVDRLITLSGLPAGQVAAALSSLELLGIVGIDCSGRYSRCKAISD